MTKLKNKLLLLFIPANIMFFVAVYVFPTTDFAHYKFEIYLIFWLILIFLKKFKFSPNPFFIAAFASLILAAFSDFMLQDTPTEFFADFAIVFLIIALVSLLGNRLRFGDGTKLTKKVLFVANAIVGSDPGVSGGESRFIELGKEWARQGYEIHLLGAASSQKLCHKMGLETKLHSVTQSTRDNRLEFFTRTIMLFFYLPALVADFDNGIVYSTSEQMYDTIPGAILKLFYANSIAFASAVHWLPPLLFWKRKSSKWYNSLFFMMSERIGLVVAFLGADCLFPVSKATYDDMKRSGFVNDRTHIVLCGVNLAEVQNITSKYQNKKYDAVFIKRIQAVKGIFDLIDIWGIVVDKKPDAHLVVIGSGIDENQAKEMVRQKNLDNNITFTGVIYDLETKYRYLAQSKIFTLPSYEENWAIVIGEGLASGLPVICYDLKELNEVWEDSVTFIPLKDKERFAEAISTLLTDAPYYQERVKKGLNYVARYDWKTIAENEIKLISQSFNATEQL